MHSPTRVEGGSHGGPPPTPLLGRADTRYPRPVVNSPYAPPASSEGPARPRSPGSPALAAVLSLIVLGAGHVYAGCARRAFAYLGAMALAAALFGALVRPAYLALGLGGMLLPAILPVAIYVHAAFDAGKRATARRFRVPVWLVVAAFVGFSLTRSLVAVGLRAFFLEAFKIPSAGVAPTLVVGDHIFTDKLTRRKTASTGPAREPTSRAASRWRRREWPMRSRSASPAGRWGTWGRPSARSFGHALGNNLIVDWGAHHVDEPRRGRRRRSSRARGQGGGR